ncbi:MAG: peptidylprolyl isomerase [Bacilli bacterium]|nr:peptidylprolyl isomerase [Bacilli bacterium]
MAKKSSNKNTSSSKAKTTKKVEAKVEKTIDKPEQIVETKTVETKIEKNTVKPVKVTKTKKEKKEKVKKEKNLVKAVKENPYLIVLCVICVLLIINIILVAVGHKAKLKDGKEIIASLDGKEYTAEDLFDKLKSSYGSTTLINLIDEYIVSQEITDNDEAKKYAEEQITSIKEQYESAGYVWEDTLSSYGYASEDALLQEIMTSYKKELVVSNYLAEKVTDDEINEYYENDVYGDYTAKHILIKPETTDDMTDEQKTAAEETARNTALEVIQKLNNGEAWATLVTQYSDDEGSVEEEGLIENFTKGDVVDEFFDAVLKLENGKYTSEPVKSEYGYHIILKISNTEKKELDDVKKEIIDSIVEDKLADDDTLYDTTWATIREEYKLSINDTTILNAYKATLKG